MSTAGDIRFSDVAHYVGLSVLHGSKPLKAGSPPASHQVSQALGSTHGGSTMRLQSSDNPEAARIQQEEMGKIKKQLMFLEAAKRAEGDQLKKLHMSMSDSALQAERARRRQEAQEEKHKFHARRANEVDQQIVKLRSEMEFRLAYPAGFKPQFVEDPVLLPLPSQHYEVGGPSRTRRKKADIVTLASTQQGFGGHGSTARELEASLVEDAEGEQSAARREKRSRAKKRRSKSAHKEEAPEEEAAPKDPPEEKEAPPAEAAVEAAAKEKQVAIANAKEPEKEAMSPELLEALSKSPKEMTDDDRREVLRMHLIQKTGSAKAAFRFLDLSGSGRISPQEFEDGMRSLNINVAAVVGLRKLRDAMKLFDADHDMNIDFRDLFPKDADMFGNGKRAATPDFCRVYGSCRASRLQPRHATWQPANAEEEMEQVHANLKKQEDAIAKRKWMQSTIRRLKGKGKSDARCRELAAQHLPRGTGLMDRQGVHTINGADLERLKQRYSDEVQIPIREAQKSIADLKEQRKEQKRIYEKLYAVTDAELKWEQAQAALGGFGFGGGGGLGLGGGGGGGDKKKDKGRSMESIAKEAGMDKLSVEDLFSDYFKFAHSNGGLEQKAFQRLIAHLCPKRTLVESDLEAWWRQVAEVRPQTGGSAGGGTRASSKAEESQREEEKWGGSVLEKDKKGKKKQDQKKAPQSCEFEQFAIWYGSWEARAPAQTLGA